MLWVDGVAPEVEPYLASVAVETLVDEIRRERRPAEATAGTVRLEAGEVRIALAAPARGR